MLSPSLTQANEQALTLATNNTVMILDALSLLDGEFNDGQMCSLVIDFLIGHCLTPEAGIQRRASSQEGVGLVRTTLIHRLDSMSESLAIATAELFSKLLDFHDPRILHILAVRNLVDGHYLLNTSLLDVRISTCYFLAYMLAYILLLSPTFLYY